MAFGRAIGQRRTAGAPTMAVRTAGGNYQTIINDFTNRFGFPPASVYQGGMSIPGAWRASIMLSDMLGAVPWDAMRTIGDIAECVTPQPSMLYQPNPPESAVNTFSSWGLDLIWHGNAIGLVASRDSNGWPTRYWAIPASMVGARRQLATNSTLAGLPIGPIEYAIAGIIYPSSEILHIKGPCEPGAVRGIGVLEAHLKTLNLARAQLDQAASISQHGVPTGVLTSDNPDLTPEEAVDIKAKWLESQQTRTIAVLNSSTHFEALAWTPEEMELTVAREFTNSELSLIFGVPARRLNVSLKGASDITYTNIEQEDIDMWRYSVGGHLARFEAALSLQMPRGTIAKANLNARLRPDTKTRYEAHQIGINSGFLLRSEARTLEDLVPVPGIDDEPEPLPAPAPPPVQATATVGQPAAIDSSATDPEGNDS